MKEKPGETMKRAVKDCEPWYFEPPPSVHDDFEGFDPSDAARELSVSTASRVYAQRRSR